MDGTTQKSAGVLGLTDPGQGRTYDREGQGTTHTDLGRMLGFTGSDRSRLHVK